MDNSKRNNVNIYEISLGILAIFSVVLLIIQERTTLPLHEEKLLDDIDFIIWCIFVADYFLHLFLTKEKKDYVKEHVIELTAILPFNALFKGVRAIRLFQLFRVPSSFLFLRIVKLLAYFGRTHRYLSRFLRRNNFQYVLFITISMVLFGAIAIRYFENINFHDALWWSFVTTTIGYGDMVPTTTGGRVIATILMLVGIGFISILTGTIASFFIAPDKEQESNNDFINVTIHKLENFDNLTLREVQDICQVLMSLKSNVVKNKLR